MIGIAEINTKTKNFKQLLIEGCAIKIKQSKIHIIHNLEEFENACHEGKQIQSRVFNGVLIYFYEEE